MVTFVISAAGVRVPAIIYGTAWKRTETGRLVARAVQCGFRGIDTACQPKHYDEAGVGAGVAASLERGLRRNELYLQTKFTPVSGHDPNRIPYDPRAPIAEQVSQSFAASLRNLGTDFLDCLILHSPLATFEKTREAWRAMESLVDSGGVRQIGISNCYRTADLEALYMEARFKPAVVQNRFHAATGFDREIRAFCLERHVLYQSFWTLTANAQILEHAAVVALATAQSRTPAQILFRFLTQSGVVPLTGTRSDAHMTEDLAIFDFELARADLQAINALLSA
jgi:diketogulonate reductase-like aldo/keto reductase